MQNFTDTIFLTDSIRTRWFCLDIDFFLFSDFSNLLFRVLFVTHTERNINRTFAFIKFKYLVVFTVTTICSFILNIEKGSEKVILGNYYKKMTITERHLKLVIMLGNI